MRRPGFTLFELVITTFVVALVGGAVYAFQTNVISVNTFLQDSLTGQQEARTTVRRFVTEARSIQIPNNGAFPIATVNPTEFTFYSDVDYDGTRERVRYFLSGSTLRRGIVEPSGDPLAYDPDDETADDVVHNVANGGTAIFSYYDANYDGTTAPLASPVDVTEVRLVKITLIIDRDPNRPPGPSTITTQTSLRNLKDNL